MEFRKKSSLYAHITGYATWVLKAKLALASKVIFKGFTREPSNLFSIEYSESVI